MGITENRLIDTNPLVNIDIDGYVFKHTQTKTRCGGAGIYIKTCYESEILQHLQPMWIYLTPYLLSSNERVIIGSIYRHRIPVLKFINTFFKDALGGVSRHTYKMCALM